MEVLWFALFVPVSLLWLVCLLLDRAKINKLAKELVQAIYDKDKWKDCYDTVQRARKHLDLCRDERLREDNKRHQQVFESIRKVLDSEDEYEHPEDYDHPDHD